MRTLTLPKLGDWPAAPAWRTGLALSVTVALFYALCTAGWVIARPQFLGFMNSLFHGIDFTPLVTDGTFGWASFVEAVAVMAIWAFLAGSFYAWLRQRLGS